MTERRMDQLSRRVEELRDRARRREIDILAVIPGPNLVHLTGLSFHLSERPVVVLFPVDGNVAMILPTFEEGKAREMPGAPDVFSYSDEEGPAGAFQRARQHLALESKALGVEGRRIRFLELELLGEVAGVTNADLLFAEGRMRKDETEIAAMRRAVAVAESAFRGLLDEWRPGMTEREVASALTLQLYRCGSDPELPFMPFAATGPGGANPHGTPSDRPTEPGHIVTIDWGAAAAGYFSDITRTVAVAGAPVPDELRRAHDAVLEANAAGRAAARPGGTGQDVDRATRAVVEKAGLGEYFTHRTGHGLGLEGHEEPDMKEGSLVPLEPGMTFTVEPGVYIPGVGGCRIEDDVVITSSGSESLTTLPRELVPVG